MKLPRRALTNVDLMKYAKILKIPHFRGVYMRNDLPSKILENESGIVNLDDKRGPGTHWTAYVKRGINVTYFDSIGRLKPPLEVIKYFRSDGSKNNITYNFERYQDLNSYNCGHLCLQFLYSYAK
jgi:hypothetical protein